MVSTTHKEAEFYYQRDFSCIEELFRKRFAYESERQSKLSLIDVENRLDLEIGVSGVNKEE
jgi:RIO kinase 2